MDRQEEYWKNLDNKKDMMHNIIWGSTEENFNRDTEKDVNRILKGLNLAGEKEGKIILDIGCGIGRLSKAIADTTPHKLVGIDVSENIINEGKNYCKGSNVQLIALENGHSIQIADEQVDHAYSHIVLQHINKFKVYCLLTHLHRILKKGGTAFLQFPNLYKSCNEKVDVYLGYVKAYIIGNSMSMHFWTIDEAKWILEKVGFKIEDVLEEGSDFYITIKKI